MPNEDKPRQAVWLDRCVDGEFGQSDNLPGNRVTLQIGDERHDLPLETVQKALLDAGWTLQPGTFTRRMVRDHGYRLIGPAEVAVLEACAAARIHKRSDGNGFILLPTDAGAVAQAIDDWRTGKGGG